MYVMWFRHFFLGPLSSDISVEGVDTPIDRYGPNVCVIVTSLIPGCTAVGHLSKGYSWHLILILSDTYRNGDDDDADGDEDNDDDNDDDDNDDNGDNDGDGDGDDDGDGDGHGSGGADGDSDGDADGDGDDNRDDDDGGDATLHGIFTASWKVEVDITTIPDHGG